MYAASELSPLGQRLRQSDSALRDRFASDSLAPTPLDWTEGYPQLPTSNFSINPAASSPAKISPILDYRISISIRLHLRLTSPFLSHSRQKRVRIRTKLLLFSNKLRTGIFFPVPSLRPHVERNLSNSNGTCTVSSTYGTYPSPSANGKLEIKSLPYASCLLSESQRDLSPRPHLR